MCSVYLCDEDRKTQATSETDGGNEFERFARLSCDWMITLAVSPSWKWPPLTGSSWRDKQKHKQPLSRGVCACLSACVCGLPPCVYVYSSVCLWLCAYELSAGDAEMRIRAPVHSQRNLIWCDCIIKLLLHTVLRANTSTLTGALRIMKSTMGGRSCVSPSNHFLYW